ncbi:ATP-binding protein [Nitratireductor sp. StC3]|uniref:sensor histidine kinase n=1 Tax=Nitratireductor sp. StC3 TaxID=2126741 RepID=UPI000D0CA92F|nr:ATP-binding protein [Nitratireductor sp. StC3]PSM18129.1 two-component sensor histidine kinase [Nitratireductor sp. StC3]
MTMRLPAIMKTTAARLSALYLLLFGACAVLLVIYMTSISVRIIAAQNQETIQEEARNLARAYERGGIPRLVRVVEQRARQPGANLYLIADPNGRILSGNVESLQPGVLELEGWTQRPFAYERYGDNGLGQRAPAPETARGRLAHTAMALVIRLPNRMILLVGRDLGEPERFRRVVQRALILALAFMGIGAFVIWFFVGRAALRRIDSISAASQRIMGGDLSGRLPVSAAGDEFDRLSDNLNAMLTRISALNEGLKQVSDNIAHDLKTPLTRLRQRAESALAGSKDKAALREALEAAIAESDQLIRTFNAILMISRLEAGYSAESTDRIDLAGIIADVAELYEPVAEERGVALKTRIAGPQTVTANRELVAQALSNVVDNAIKYCAGHATAPAVSIALEKTEGEVRIVIADNGPGIPAGDRKRATERFVRLEASRSQPGSGLGLSLARAVMTFHRGRLELADADPGLKVAMIFPAAGAAS